MNVRSFVAVLGLMTLAVLALPGQALASLGVGPTPVTSFSYTSAFGDPVGKGGSATFSPADGATFRIGGSAADVTVLVDAPGHSWSMELAAPSGEVLRPGVYRGAQRVPFNTGRAPGLDVNADGEGCSAVYGSFAIDQIESDANGTVTRLQGSFTQHCESPTAAALRGKIDYRVVPLLYRFRSDPGDFVGSGLSGSYTNATTIFDAAGDRSGVEMTISTTRGVWDVSLVPPAGQLLSAKTYGGAEEAPFQSPGHPGLSVTNSHGCDGITGSFTIEGIRADRVTHAVTFLAATFVQHCEGAVPALRGTMVWHA